MSIKHMLRERCGLGVSVASAVRLGHVSGREVRLMAPWYVVSTGGVRPQVGVQMTAMADITPDAADKGLNGVRDWSPPA